MRGLLRKLPHTASTARRYVHDHGDTHKIRTQVTGCYGTGTRSLGPGELDLRAASGLAFALTCLDWFFSYRGLPSFSLCFTLPHATLVTCDPILFHPGSVSLYLCSLFPYLHLLILVSHACPLVPLLIFVPVHISLISLSFL